MNWTPNLKKTVLSLSQPQRSLAVLALIMLGGLLLRFWQLEAKALWLDEVIGALFSLGRSLDDVPLNQVIPLSALNSLFTVEPGMSCGQIAQTVATDSVHPPVYFCLMYRWMATLQPDGEHWVWVLRSLPALIGVFCIPALYLLNRLAFSSQAALAGAALMAVSPFAVYLSQEARHYTLPMLLTLVALMGLVQIQRAIGENRSIALGWLVLWAIANSVGLYVHYFYILDVLAQVGALALWLLWQIPKTRNARAVELRGLARNWGRLMLALVAITASYLPWLPTVIAHFGRPETDWLKPYNPDWSDRIAPIYQTVSGWLLMVVALPLEDQPWSVAVPAALAMLGIGGWILWNAARGWRSLWRTAPAQRPALLLLGSFVVCVLVQFFAITYILDKNVTAVPRYNFVYYPGMAALLGVGLAQRSRRVWSDSSVPAALGEQPVETRFPSWPSLRHPLAIALLAGLLSSVLVVYGLVFQKGYYPHKVAQDMAFEGDRPVLLVVSYQSLQEVGLGLSFALELQKQYPEGTEPPVGLAFVHRPDSYRDVWRSLSRLEHDLPLPLNLWVVASPGMKTEDYPETLQIREPGGRRRVTCSIVPERFNRIGFPYQLFRCQPNS